MVRSPASEPRLHQEIRSDRWAAAADRRMRHPAEWLPRACARRGLGSHSAYQARQIIKPVDVTVAPRSDLNTNEFERRFADWPDQECLGFICDGMNYKADLLEQDMHLVLCPNLVSLRNGFESVEKEIVRLSELGYHEAFAGVPFCRCAQERKEPCAESLSLIATGA